MKEKTHLRYCMHGAYIAGEKDHPQKVMKAIGIEYERAIPQSIGDQWWFLHCSNLPVELPEFLTMMELSDETKKNYGIK